VRSSAAVFDGFGDVFGFDDGGVFDIGDGAGDFQDAFVAGAKSLLSHGAFEEAFAVGGEISEKVRMRRDDIGHYSRFFHERWRSCASLFSAMQTGSGQRITLACALLQ
jgi:hypothetical protein